MVNGLIGLVLGVFVGVYIGFILAGWESVVNSASVGFGIGLAFIAAGWAVNQIIKLGDRLAQKVKSGAGE